MNKLYILSGIIALQCITNTNAAEKKDRHQTRLILYKLLQQEPINWAAIFSALDNSRDPIDVNTFINPMKHSTLLIDSVVTGNLRATETLLSKYNANPNTLIPIDTKNNVTVSPLMLACIKENYDMIQLLLLYKGNPHLRSPEGNNCFDIASENPEVLRLLNSYKQN